MKIKSLLLIPLVLSLCACQPPNPGSGGGGLLSGGLGTGSGSLTADESAALDRALKAETDLKTACEDKARTMRRTTTVSTADLEEGQRKYGYVSSDLASLRSSLANDIRTNGIDSVSDSSRQAAERYRKSAGDFVAHSDKALGYGTRKMTFAGALLMLDGIMKLGGLWTGGEAAKRQAYASAVENRLSMNSWSSL